MSAASLKVVPLSGQISFGNANKKPHPKADNIFFLKLQIGVGTHLINVGRKERPSGWIVTRIISHNAHGRPISVGEVQYLSDRIYLRRANGASTNAERSGTFSYLSYSAIWRIA